MLIGLALFLIGGAIAVHAVRDLHGLHPPPATYTLWPLALALGVKTMLMATKMRPPASARPITSAGCSSASSSSSPASAWCDRPRWT